jgi:hypothetical protein
MASLDDAKNIIESCLEEERDYFDTMPEGLKASERGTKAEDDVSGMEEVVSSLEDAIRRMEDVTG